jgi:TIR domain
VDRSGLGERTRTGVGGTAGLAEHPPECCNVLGAHGMTPLDVFLSHNHGDKEFVRRLATDLRDAGVPVWLDEWELRVGDSLVDRIESGIAQAGYLAVVLSPRSVGSAWVKRELNAALAEEIRRRGVFILPILIEDCDLPLFLRDKMYADFRRDYAEGLGAIMRVVLPGDVTPPKLLFDSRHHDPAFTTWALHCSDGAALAGIRLVASDDGSTHAIIRGAPGRSVGLNKSVPVSSLRITATRASFGVLPLLNKRW